MACTDCELNTLGVGTDEAIEGNIFSALGYNGAGVDGAVDNASIADTATAIGAGVSDTTGRDVDVMVGVGAGVGTTYELITITSSRSAIGTGVSAATDTLASYAASVGAGTDGVSDTVAMVVEQYLPSGIGLGTDGLSDTVRVTDTAVGVGTGMAVPVQFLSNGDSVSATGTGVDGLHDSVFEGISVVGAGVDGVVSDSVAETLSVIGTGASDATDTNIVGEVVSDLASGYGDSSATYDIADGQADIAEGYGYPDDTLGSTLYTWDVSTFGVSTLEVGQTLGDVIVIDSVPVVSYSSGVRSMDGADREGTLTTGAKMLGSTAGNLFNIHTVWYESDFPSAMTVSAFTPSSAAEHRATGTSRGRVKLGRGASDTVWRLTFSASPLSLREAAAEVSLKSRRY